MKLRSLKAGATAAARRVLAGVIAASTAPVAATAGIPTTSARFLHVVGKLNDGTSIKIKVWLRDSVSQEWTLDTDLGSNGLVTITQASPTSNPFRGLVEIAGIEEVYVQTLSPVGVLVAGLDVWLAGSTV
jgi:hypothetical protein